MRVVGVLPAKGSSERVEGKNVKPLGGTPLFKINLKKLVSSVMINEAYLDTESEQLIALAKDVRCKAFKRDPLLASNQTDGNKLLVNFAKSIDADIYVMLLCTSPFISVTTINKAVKILVENKRYDSVVAVRKEKFYQWKDGMPSYNVTNIPNSKDLNDTVIETMSLYVIRKEVLLNDECRIGRRPYLLELTHLESLDINYPDDFELAEVIHRGLHK